jgi:hypothetical protein
MTMGNFIIGLISILIWLFIAASGIFLILFRYKKLMRKKNELLLLAGAIVFSLVAAEIILRIALPIQYNRYGWSPPINRTVEVNYGIAGQERSYITYFDYGFRAWGNISSNRTKIMIIGDSYTAGPGVSSGEEYFSHIRSEFSNIELFAFGEGGYGTTQEYLVLNDTFDIINPDIVIWQFTNNDFVDNNFHSDKNTGLGARALKPYLIEGIIKYEYPFRHSKIMQKSSLVRNAILLRDKVFFTPDYGPTAKTNYEVTKENMIMVLERLNGTGFMMFEANQASPEFWRLCHDLGIYCISTLPLDKDEKYFLPDDSHWNTEGHKEVGRLLTESINRSYAQRYGLEP